MMVPCINFFACLVIFVNDEPGKLHSLIYLLRGSDACCNNKKQSQYSASAGVGICLANLAKDQIFL